MIPSKDAIVQHSKTPPCHCPACLRATALAERRRAEIEAIERESFCSVLASMEAGSDE